MPWLLPPAPRFQPDDAEDPAGADLTWAYDWPAGCGLARDLAGLVDCRGRRVADLGCGRGGLGAAALQAGAAAVAFCDGSARALAYVAAAIRLNLAGERACCHRHRWGEALPEGAWDLILGGDLLYRPAAVPALLGSIAASLGADGCTLLSDPRHQVDDELLAAAQHVGLVAVWQQADGYSLYRLHRRA